MFQGVTPAHKRLSLPGLFTIQGAPKVLLQLGLDGRIIIGSVSCPEIG